jgi:hypothetical protein
VTFHYDLYDYDDKLRDYVFRGTFKIMHDAGHYVASSNQYNVMFEQRTRAAILMDVITYAIKDWDKYKFRVYNGDRIKTYDVNPEFVYPYAPDRIGTAYHVTEKDGMNYRDDILVIQPDHAASSLTRVCEWIA